MRLHRGVPFVAGLTAALCLLTPGALAADQADLAGTWKWQWKDAQNETHKHVLEIEGRGDKLGARERFDDQEAVKVTDLKVDGKKMSFSVLRGTRRSAYTGTLGDTDTINGKVMVTIEGGEASEYGWTATRDPVKKK